MLNYKAILFLLLSISLIICEETKIGEAQKPPEVPKNETKKEKPKVEKETKSKQEYNLTMDEMDTMMFCSIITRETIHTKKKDIEEVKKRINVSLDDIIYEKVGSDIFEKCVKNVDIKEVNSVMKNLTYLNNYQRKKEYDKLSHIDFSKYQNMSDLQVTIDQYMLMLRFQRVEEKFKQKMADQRAKIDNENQKIRIGQLDMEKIPSSIKFGIFLFILVLLFGGSFYFLKQLGNKPKDKKKKDKEKKKKNQ